MRIQDLAIIFIIIILPISLVLAIYTQNQIKTINTQTLYDSKLSSATYDAIRAMQINTIDNDFSELSNSKIRDLEASVSTFRNSIKTAFSLDGYSEDELNNYIPALVYTLYDGFYIYSPYTNTNYRYDEEGNAKDDNGENIYGLKPYITYSCRYVKDNIDVVISYALDNYITVQGKIGDEYVNKEGYLIDNIYGKNNSEINNINEEIYYNGIKIEEECLEEYVSNTKYKFFYDYSLRKKIYYDPTNAKLFTGDSEFDKRHENNYLIIELIRNSETGDNTKGGKIGEEVVSKKAKYVKLNGTKYYLDEDNFQIYYISNGQKVVQCNKGDTNYENYEKMIKNNNSAKQYYYDAYMFTKWFKDSGLSNLTYENAYDSIIDEDGNVLANSKVWEGNTTKIFEFNTSNDYSKNIENELSAYNQHRLSVIRHKIEVNLAIAIANYNTYSGASNVFQMPDLREDEWDYIINNISLISFLQGLPIGGKIYNGYSLVTNSESEEVVLEEKIYMLGTNTKTGKKEYYRIGDVSLENGDVTLNQNSAGRLNLDFLRRFRLEGEQTNYYYPLKDYNASYNSIVMQNDMTTYDDIYKYVNNQSDELKKAFYTALGRERWGNYKVSVENINKKNILYVGYVWEDKTETIVKGLSQNQDYKVDYKYYPTGTSLDTIGSYIEGQKKNYDLIILNTYAWDGIPYNLKDVITDTNIITIANDVKDSNKIPMIESGFTTETRENQIDSVYATNIGKQKIGIEIGKNLCVDGSCALINVKDDENINVLYKMTRGGNEYDAICSWKAESGKTWVHSQISLNDTCINIINALAKYALYGY